MGKPGVTINVAPGLAVFDRSCQASGLLFKNQRTGRLQDQTF
jgi:hypothetical protein